MTEAKQLEVKNYYSNLNTSADLLTSACKTCQTPSSETIKEALKMIHPEVTSKFYGCGLVFPELLDGLVILDLGSGSGRDCFVLSKLCGPKGKIIGIDMTESQIEVSTRYIDHHMKAWGYKEPNVSFIHGYIEDLTSIEDNSIDLIVSNCVINLSNEKEKVLSECYRVLKEGGEMYFSDVYSDRRVPESCKNNEILWGECLSGALYYNDFYTLCKKIGFVDSRLVESDEINIHNMQVKNLLGDITFFSSTYRLFKIKNLEPYCEDYGQLVIYKGTIPEHPDRLKLDSHHIFEKDEEFKVCGNTYLMLSKTRYANHFQFIGDTTKHYGLFKGCNDENSQLESTSKACKGNKSMKSSCC